MRRFAVTLSAIISGGLLSHSAFAQAMARSPAATSESAQLEALTKKIEEQNAKIDTLSQQILKLEQQISNMRPGVIIGEATPAPVPSVSSTETNSHSAKGDSYVVARGDTLTSIAKMHSVTVGELQKYNHIENDRKLQIGQTIMIPPSPAPTTSTSTPSD